MISNSLAMNFFFKHIDDLKFFLFENNNLYYYKYLKHFFEWIVSLLLCIFLSTIGWREKNFIHLQYLCIINMIYFASNLFSFLIYILFYTYGIFTKLVLYALLSNNNNFKWIQMNDHVFTINFFWNIYSQYRINMLK